MYIFRACHWRLPAAHYLQAVAVQFVYLPNKTINNSLLFIICLIHNDCQFFPFFKTINMENFVYCLKHSGMILFSYLTDFSYFTLKIVFQKLLDTVRTNKKMTILKGGVDNFRYFSLFSVILFSDLDHPWTLQITWIVYINPFEVYVASKIITSEYL